VRNMNCVSHLCKSLHLYGVATYVPLVRGLVAWKIETALRWPHEKTEPRAMFCWGGQHEMCESLDLRAAAQLIHMKLLRQTHAQLIGVTAPEREADEVDHSRAWLLTAAQAGSNGKRAASSSGRRMLGRVKRSSSAAAISFPITSRTAAPSGWPCLMPELIPITYMRSRACVGIGRG